MTYHFTDMDEVLLGAFTLAARKPEFRSIAHRWMQNSRSALGRFVDPETAFDLDALIEGLFIHTSLDQPARPRASTERAVRRQLT